MEIRRRDVLAGATGLAGVLAGCSSDLGPDRDRDGIEDVYERNLAALIEEEYGNDQVPDLDPDEKDLIIDAHYVEGEDFADRYKDELEDLFAEQGIDLHWLDHPDRYDRDRFEDRYGHEVDEILEEGFYDAVTVPELRDNAVQMLFVPGKADEPHEGELYAPSNPGPDDDHHFTGYSRVNRATVGSAVEGEVRARTVLHEIAHLAVDHDYDDEDNEGVMGQKEELDMTEEEWDELRDGLSNVDPVI